MTSTVKIVENGRTVYEGPDRRANPARADRSADRAQANGEPSPLPVATSDKPAPVEVNAERVKNPAKVAAGKARAAQAALRKAAAAGGAQAPAPVAKKAPAKKAAAKKAPAKKAKSPARVAAGKRIGAAKKAATKARPAKKAPRAAAGDGMVVVAFRAPKELKKKLGKLGGGEFLRKRIDAATVPAGA